MTRSLVISALGLLAGTAFYAGLHTDGAIFIAAMLMLIGTRK